jgi:hypothetical protein
MNSLFRDKGGRKGRSFKNNTIRSTEEQAVGAKFAIAQIDGGAPHRKYPAGGSLLDSNARRADLDAGGDALIRVDRVHPLPDLTN